jgi:hypothetical protein
LYLVFTKQVLGWSASAQEAANGIDDRRTSFEANPVLCCGGRVKHGVQTGPVAVVETSGVGIENSDDGVAI